MCTAAHHTGVVCAGTHAAARHMRHACSTCCLSTAAQQAARWGCQQRLICVPGSCGAAQEVCMCHNQSTASTSRPILQPGRNQQSPRIIMGSLVGSRCSLPLGRLQLRPPLVQLHRVLIASLCVHKRSTAATPTTGFFSHRVHPAGACHCSICV